MAIAESPRGDSHSRLPKKINFCQIDNFVSAAAQDRFEREQTKARGLFQSDCRRRRSPIQKLGRLVAARKAEAMV
jgi:hypothetical protein